MGDIFDGTFDYTFQNVLAGPTNPSAPDVCRLKGCYMYWLTKTGWFPWLFEGGIRRSKNVVSRGTITKQGHERYNKATGWVYTIRTANLSEVEADVVGSIYESSGVYMMVINGEGKFIHVPVSIEPGRFDIWDSKKANGSLEVQFSLPPIRMQRI